LENNVSAIQAELVNYKRIPSRKAFQIILEVPEENQKLVHDVLGYPTSGESLWVGVARITPQQD
jgi:hypothetical protein